MWTERNGRNPIWFRRLGGRRGSFPVTFPSSSECYCKCRETRKCEPSDVVRPPSAVNLKNKRETLVREGDGSFGGSSVVVLDDVTVDRGLHYFRSTASNTKRLRGETTCIFRVFWLFFCAFRVCQKKSKSSSQALGHFINDIVWFPIDCRLQILGE